MEKETQFRAALEGNKDRIYRICCCYFQEEAERNDVYQEILMNIWKSLDNFRGRSQLSTWIYRITVNTCINNKRTENRRRQIFSSISTADQERFPSRNSDDPSDKIEQAIQDLYACINKLTPLDKTLISLYMEDLGTREMADVLGISEANVRVKLHRIKKVLKNMLERCDDGS